MPKFCKYCGDPITEGELFCDNCGKRIEGETPPPKPVCARCGAELNPASKFCRSCGAPVSGTPSPRPAAGRTPPPPPVARRPPPLPRATTPSGPPPAPAPAPIPSAPAAPPEKRRKKGCCGCVFGFVSVVLVVLGVAALGIMAFYHPGFLLKDKEESLETILERMDSEGSIESFLNTDFAITKETSPGNPRLIKTTWSELDVKGSEVFVADVAPDAGSVTLETSAGTVGVDFTFLNPEDGQEDRLAVHVLPELHDANSGMTLHGYDFSLESGRHVFAARNRITIPRHAPDNKDGQVYYYNPDTKEYEFVYCEMSEDGKSYYAYLDHFSIVVEGIPDYFHPAKNSTRILYHEPDEDRKWPVMARSVAVSDKDLKNWMEKSRIDLLEVCKKGVKPTDGLAVFIDTVSGWDATKSASEDFMKIVTCADKFKFGNCLISTGHALLLAKITYQLRKAPSKNLYKVFKQNTWDLAAAGSLAAIKLFGLGTIGVPIGTAIIATSLTWNSFGLLQYARAYFGDPPIVLTWRDAGYQRFLRYWYTPLEIGNVRYGVSFWTHHAVSAGATTPRQIMESSGIELLENRDYMYLTVRDILLKNQNDPDALQTDLETLKIQYLRYFWNLEPETRRDWCYKDYVDEYIALHRRTVFAEYGRTRGEISSNLHPKYLEEYKDPDKDTINSYIETHEAYIDKCIQSRVRAVLWEDFCKKQETLKKLLADKVLPAFNDRIYFFVKDSDLPEGTHFDQSPYSAYHKNREIKDYGRYMWFLDAKGKPVETGSYGEYAFYPNNADKSDYGEEARQPYPRENSDFVFHCSRYHFMQMGAPGWLVLHGRLDWPEVRIPIEIPPPDGSGTTRVELVIPKQSVQNALQKFAGVWRPVDDLKKRGLPTSWMTAFIYFPKHNEFCVYEGAERAQSDLGLWTEIRKFDYDKKTGILTIDYRLNNPDGGTGVATYRINHEGRLLMHNAQTGEDSVWIRVATQSGWPKMEKDMDDFLEKVREAAAKKPTDNKPRSTSGVVVGGVIRIGNE